MNRSSSSSSSSSRMNKLLDSEQQDRARDQGHFTMYGMRVDPHEGQTPERENPGHGDNARRYGAGGDLSTYANRAPDTDQVVKDNPGSDAPAHKTVP